MKTQCLNNSWTPSNLCSSLKQCRICTVNDIRSLKRPCRRTASRPHSLHRRSTTNWWTGACRAHSRAPLLHHSRAWARAWWSVPWRGWWLWGRPPTEMGRSLCSGRRCIHGERWSSPTSRSHQSQQRVGPAGRIGRGCGARNLRARVVFWSGGPGALVLLQVGLVL